MPIRILSLPAKDLQYAINSMDLSDAIAFSLCSKRTENLVKSSNRKIRPIAVYVDEKDITVDIRNYEETYIYLQIFDSYIKLSGRIENSVWRKQEFTQNDWIAHLMSIFGESMIDLLHIGNTSLSYLDTIKQSFPKCHRLAISGDCSREFTKITFSKLYSIAEKVEIEKNIFDNENDKSKFLTLNLNSLSFDNWKNPLELKLDDLLVLNIADLKIDVANISEKELNRFLKLWMKSNHAFYRPKAIRLFLEEGIEINYEQVFKGIKYEDVPYNDDDFPTFRLNRGDGKEMRVFIEDNYIAFKVL